MRYLIIKLALIAAIALVIMAPTAHATTHHHRLTVAQCRRDARQMTRQGYSAWQVSAFRSWCINEAHRGTW